YIKYRTKNKKIKLRRKTIKTVLFRPKIIGKELILPFLSPFISSKSFTISRMKFIKKAKKANLETHLKADAWIIWFSAVITGSRSKIPTTIKLNPTKTEISKFPRRRIFFK